MNYNKQLTRMAVEMVERKGADINEAAERELRGLN